MELVAIENLFEAVGEDLIEAVSAAKRNSARVEVLESELAELKSTHPQMLDEDTHPWPKDGSEFEVIFERPESVTVEWVEYKGRWLTVDGYAVLGDVEGWLPVSTKPT